MPSEAVEVQLARVEEQLNAVRKAFDDSRESRAKQYEMIDGLRTAIMLMGNRLENVEGQLATAQPTIQEFITIKHKVAGAGDLGRWLWTGGAALIGFVAGSREIIIHWLRGAAS